MRLSEAHLCRYSLFWAYAALTALSPLVLADFNQTSDLYSQLFAGVDTRVRPSINTSIPTDVYVDFNLLSLREIEQTEQYFVINAWLGVTWQDEVRSWDPNQHGGVRFVYPGMTGMWRPSVIVTNSIEERDVFANDPCPLTLASDGTARWYPGTVFYLSCPMDMTYFPFDRQRCLIRFLAQEYGTEVNLIPARETANTNNYAGHGEWDLESTRVESRVINYGGIKFSRLSYHFTFKRRSAFYLMNVLVPVVLLSLLSPLVFVLPEESGERVSYSVTLLLSLSVFMGIVAGHLPQSSEPLSITIVYLFVLVIHSGLCVVSCVVHLRLQQCNAQSSPEPLQAPQHQQCNTPKADDSVAIEHITLRDEPKEETHSKNQLIGEDASSRSSGILGKSICNANTVLVIFFYVSWFAISGYFLARLL